MNINEILNNQVVITVFEIIVTVLLTWAASKTFNYIYKKVINDTKLNLSFLKSIITGIIWFIGIFNAISKIPGMSGLAKTMLAGSGVAAVVITLGAQKSFGNIVSGLLLSISRPFDIGDRVILTSGGKDITGFIEEITLRHTVIRTYKNTEYIISNATLDSMIIENTSRRNDEDGIVEFIDISVAYESDLLKAIEIIENVVGNHELFYDTRTEEDKKNEVKKVTARVRNFGDSGIDIRVSAKTKNINDSFVICSDARIRIKEEFDNNNIEIPYNKVVVING